MEVWKIDTSVLLLKSQNRLTKKIEVNESHGLLNLFQTHHKNQGEREEGRVIHLGEHASRVEWPSYQSLVLCNVHVSYLFLLHQVFLLMAGIQEPELRYKKRKPADRDACNHNTLVLFKTLRKVHACSWALPIVQINSYGYYMAEDTWMTMGITNRWLVRNSMNIEWLMWLAYLLYHEYLMFYVHNLGCQSSSCT